MVVALKPVRFYGCSLPRPRFYKPNEERVDSPVPILDPLMAWAEDAHWSVGGVSCKRHRFQGRIEGNIEKLRAEREETPEKGVELVSLESSPPIPPAPYVLKRKRRLVDESEDVESGLARKLEFEESGVDVEAIAGRSRRSRRNEDVAVDVVDDQVKSKAESLKKSSKRTSARLAERRSP